MLFTVGCWRRHGGRNRGAPASVVLLGVVLVAMTSHSGMNNRAVPSVTRDFSFTTRVEMHVRRRASAGAASWRQSEAVRHAVAGILDTTGRLLHGRARIGERAIRLCKVAFSFQSACVEFSRIGAGHVGPDRGRLIEIERVEHQSPPTASATRARARVARAGSGGRKYSPAISP